MIRAVGVAVIAMLVPLGGCGVRPTGVVYAGDAPVATAPAGPQAQVYFLIDGVPKPIPRAVNPEDAQQVFDTLLAGPTANESAKGLSTELTGIKYVFVQDLGARTLLIETDPPAARLSPAAYAQLYCTGAMLPERPTLKIPYVSDGTEPMVIGRFPCEP
jgi:hypothetical protein